MKREGPCWHCGIAYTPLWRSGPTEKPVLCNACGSRWRIRGTLADYVPKHATNHNQSRKPSNGGQATKPCFSFACFEEETTNRSGSSSTASSETCVRTENINGFDEFKNWDKESIPRGKRSVLSQRVLSPIERLHKDLLQIMYHQQVFEQSEVEEDELIYENTNSFSSLTETAYGAMLLQSPNIATNENKRENLGKENETKLETPMSPLTGKETESESHIMETDINPEFPLTEKETKSKFPTSFDQLSLKSLPPSNQVAQKYECPPCVRKRGRPRKETKRSAGHKCTSSRDESANGLKDVYIHPLHPSEVRGCQLQDNQTVEGKSAIPSTWAEKRD